VNFAIRYLTEYHYDRPVEDNLNVLRITPATTATQRCEGVDLLVEPEARLTRHHDYFDTQVIELGVAAAHEQLTIDARARVATTPPPAPADPPWSAIADEPYREAAAEFLIDPRPAPADGMVDELVAATRADTPLATVERLVEVIPDRFEYQPGSTYVGSTVEDLLAGGAGVCQDFVHLSLILLRRHGIAARYVSGYLFAAPDGDATESLEVAMHAWIEALLPDGDGDHGAWVGADPTNRRLPGEDYVKVGHGRHYADLPPIKGVFRGGGSSRMDARVTMTRTDPPSA
jgi:transglutaminase-like putative cysteine protease